jgi:hypothetical protein
MATEVTAHGSPLSKVHHAISCPGSVAHGKDEQQWAIAWSTARILTLADIEGSCCKLHACLTYAAPPFLAFEFLITGHELYSAATSTQWSDRLVPFACVWLLQKSIASGYGREVHILTAECCCDGSFPVRSGTVCAGQLPILTLNSSVPASHGRFELSTSRCITIHLGVTRPSPCTHFSTFATSM